MLFNFYCCLKKYFTKIFDYTYKEYTEYLYMRFVASLTLTNMQFQNFHHFRELVSKKYFNKDVIYITLDL